MPIHVYAAVVSAARRRHFERLFVPRTIVVLVYTCFVWVTSPTNLLPPGQPKDMFFEGTHKVSINPLLFPISKILKCIKDSS